MRARWTPLALASMTLCAACSDPPRLVPRDAGAEDRGTVAANDGSASIDASAPLDAAAPIDVASPTDVAADRGSPAVDASSAPDARADASACPMIVGDDGTGLFPPECQCIPNTTRACSLGPRQTAGVGACRRGVQRCLGTGEIGRWSATCEGALAPAADETCGDGIDNDCDGMTDEACGCTVGATMPCYSGPARTEGVGACRGGTRTCIAGSPATFGACVGEVVPRAEACGDRVDNDCDGMTDEDCAVSGPMCAMGTTVENAAGRYIVVANYDGGRATIDVDRPVEFVGVIAYEPVEVAITGAAAASVRRVHIVGYNSMTAVVSGVAPALVERAGMPMATLADPAGWPRMVCASTCRPGASPGGCNTLAQVLDYFDRTFSAPRMWWHMQYGTFTGTAFVASRGGCCGS